MYIVYTTYTPYQSYIISITEAQKYIDTVWLQSRA